MFLNFYICKQNFIVGKLLAILRKCFLFTELKKIMKKIPIFDFLILSQC